ncbi:MAG: VWA domain-containing protein [Candidatus Eremiobacteraeota bacterium]|nr:VWA domain-containing protein [Candidatus Eremiobacteraeota bacterium]MBC5827696.1 VWA domain-containing protein [Candidatus Eremiobacteraeota bacterium]
MSNQDSAASRLEPGAFVNLGRNVIAFARALRRFGFAIPPEGTALLMEALTLVGLESHDQARAAAASIVVRGPGQRTKFDSLFYAFWNARGLRPLLDASASQPLPRPAATARDDFSAREGSAQTAGSAALSASAAASSASAIGAAARPLGGDRSCAYSFAEGLYEKDLSRLDPSQAQQIRDSIFRQAWTLGQRTSRRTRAGHERGKLDLRRSLRASLRSGGEILKFDTRVRRTKQRDIVLLCDISGSMDRYSQLLIQFIHTVRHAFGNVEAFVFGTRLTRITRELKQRDIGVALADISRSVADWAGGTRIGESLHSFNRQWSRRVLARGAIVIIISDGWDRGDVAMLAREMHRLQRCSFRLIWLNPLLGSARYRPQTIGMRAALPYIDNFLPAHNLKSMVELAALLHQVQAHRPMRPQLQAMVGDSA